MGQGKNPGSPGTLGGCSVVREKGKKDDRPPGTGGVETGFHQSASEPEGKKKIKRKVGRGPGDPYFFFGGTAIQAIKKKVGNSFECGGGKRGCGGSVSFSPCRKED